MEFQQKESKEMPLVTVIVAVVLLVVGGWYYLSYQQPVEEQKIEQVTEKKVPQKLVVAFGTQNKSGQVGNAVFEERDGKLYVKVDVFNAPKDIPQPAHIHEGSCPNPGAVKYPLTSLVNGQSETVLDITLENLLGSLPLSVNVHKSEKDAGTYVSCGNISRENLVPIDNNTPPVPQVSMPPPPPTAQ